MILGYLLFDLAATTTDDEYINIEDLNGLYSKAGRTEPFNLYTELARADNEMVWVCNLPLADLMRLKSTHGTITWEESSLVFDDEHGEDVSRPTELLHCDVFYRHKDIMRLLPKKNTSNEEQAKRLFRINENLNNALEMFFDTSLELGEAAKTTVLNPVFQSLIHQDPLAQELKKIFVNEQFKESISISALKLPQKMVNASSNDVAFIRFNPVSQLKNILQANIPPNISPQAGKALKHEDVPKGANIFLVQIKGSMPDGSMDFWMGYKKWMLCKDDVIARAFMYYQNTGESAKVAVAKNMFLPFIEFSLSFGLIAKEITTNITRCVPQKIKRSQGAFESAEEAEKADKGVIDGVVSYQNWLYQFEKEALLIEAVREFEDNSFDTVVDMNHEWDGFYLTGVASFNQEKRDKCDALCEAFGMISPFGAGNTIKPKTRAEELSLISRRVGQTSLDYQLDLDKFIINTLKQGEKDGKEKAMINILRHMNATMPSQFESKTQKVPTSEELFTEDMGGQSYGDGAIGMVVDSQTQGN